MFCSQFLGFGDAVFNRRRPSSDPIVKEGRRFGLTVGKEVGRIFSHKNVAIPRETQGLLFVEDLNAPK